MNFPHSLSYNDPSIKIMATNNEISQPSPKDTDKIDNLAIEALKPSSNNPDLVQKRNVLKISNEKITSKALEVFDFFLLPSDLSNLVIDQISSLKELQYFASVIQKRVFTAKKNGDWHYAEPTLRYLYIKIVNHPDLVPSHVDLNSTDKFEQLKKQIFDYMEFISQHPRFISLNFSFPFVSEEDLKSIKKWAPQLQNLDLGNCKYLNPSDLRYLPVNLLSLNLQCVDQLDDLALAQLPRTLKKLTIYAANLTAEGFANLPSELEELCIDGPVPSGFEKILPNKLLVLSIRQPLDDLSLAQLPRTLKELTIHTANLTAEDFANLPSELEELYIDGPVPSGFGKFLPNKLIVLFIRQPFNLIDADIQGLPRTLQELHIGRLSGLSPQATRYLPPSLTKLSLKIRLNIDSLRMLPKSLTELSLYTYQSDCPSVNPLTNSNEEFLDLPLLKKFDTDILFDDDFMQLLPRSLTELSLSQAIITDRGIAQLSSSLEKLYLPHAISYGHSFANLSRKLRELELPRYSLDAKPYDESAIQNLPNTLTHLNLSSFALTANQVNELPRGLKTLHISSYEISEEEDVALPDGLEELHLLNMRGYNESLISNKHMHFLPRALKTLVMEGVNSLTDDFAKLLPRNLEILKIEEAFNLTEKAFPDLPPKLKKLTTSGGTLKMPKKN